MTDSIRLADIDNPRGYYDWEPIKGIREHPELLDDPALEGKAIKCISMLLSQMPTQDSYKVIFLTRPIEEVALSQGTMQASPSRGCRTRGRAIASRPRGAPRRNPPLAEAPHIDFI
ncbi:MAG: hypothetical protein ACR2HH_04925 [Chthoniobacterales bacterium]